MAIPDLMLTMVLLPPIAGLIIILFNAWDDDDE